MVILFGTWGILLVLFVAVLSFAKERNDEAYSVQRDILLTKMVLGSATEEDLAEFMAVTDCLKELRHRT